MTREERNKKLDQRIYMEKRPDLIKELGIKEKCLDNAKQQTQYKIRYVSEYVREWLYVAVNMDVKNIIFIDAMANAGIYKDGAIGTSIEVLMLFREFADQHRDKSFYLLLNDRNKDRLVAQDKLIAYFMGDSKPDNIIIQLKDDDVNDYLENYQMFDEIIGHDRSMCVLFVDPYNFRTVRINRIQRFVERYYCEVLFNIFTSDRVRNDDDSQIQECLGDNIIPTGKDTINVIANALKTGYIKFAFSYAFRIRTNIELYQIMFLTPNKRGLEKLKDAVWTVFDGAKYYRNTNMIPEQISMFDSKEIQSYTLQEYASDAQGLLLQDFHGKGYSYEEIELFIIQNTMLRSSHVIKNVIKPLMKTGQIIKEGHVNGKNYKGDRYTINGGINN